MVKSVHAYVHIMHLCVLDDYVQRCEGSVGVYLRYRIRSFVIVAVAVVVEWKSHPEEPVSSLCYDHQNDKVQDGSAGESCYCTVFGESNPQQPLWADEKSPEPLGHGVRVVLSLLSERELLLLSGDHHCCALDIHILSSVFSSIVPVLTAAVHICGTDLWCCCV